MHNGVVWPKWWFLRTTDQNADRIIRFVRCDEIIAPVLIQVTRGERDRLTRQPTLDIGLVNDRVGEVRAVEELPVVSGDS